MTEQIFNNHELFLRYSGLSSAAEVKKSLAQHHGNSRIDDVTDVIADFLHCDDDAVRPGMLNEIVAFVQMALTTNPRLRVAVITNKPESIQPRETCATFESAHFPIQVFDSLNMARQWFARTPKRSKHASMLEY